MTCLLHVHGLRRCSRSRGLLSYEGGEAGQRGARPSHVVHHYLSSVETDDSAALWFRVCVTRVIAHRTLLLPRLPQSIVHVRIMIHERMRFRFYALVLALRILHCNNSFIQISYKSILH